MSIPVSFESLTSLTELFEYDDGFSNFEVFVTNAEQHCVQFCDFVQYHTFVYYFSNY
jgi:hypothetical protein